MALKGTKGGFLKRRMKRGIFTLILFFSVVFGSHILFFSFSEGRDFLIRGVDASAQFAVFRQALAQMWGPHLWDIHFWNWNLGLGGDALSELSYYYSTSPFFWISVVFAKLIGFSLKSPANAARVLLLSSMIHQFLLMLSCFAFLHSTGGERDPEEKQNAWIFHLIGAVVYGTLGNVLYRTMLLDFMLPAMMMAPLILAGLEKMRRGQSAVLYVVALGLLFMSNFYFAYMACLSIAVYWVIFWLDLHDWRLSIKRALRCIGDTLVAFLLGAVGFLPSLFGFLSAAHTRGSQNVPLFPSLTHFSEVWKEPFSLLRGHGLWTMLVGLLMVMLIFRRVYLAEEDRKKVRFALVLYLFSLFPVISSIYNGFSYPTDRWLFWSDLAICWCIPVALRVWKETMAHRMLWALLFFGGVGWYLCVLYTEGRIGVQTHRGGWIAGFTLGAVLLLLLMQGRDLKKKQRWVEFGLLFFAASLGVLHSQQVSDELSPEGRSSARLLDASWKAAGIEHEPRFFGRVANRLTEQKGYIAANSALAAGVKGLSVYNSLIPGDQMEWFYQRHHIYQPTTMPSHIHGMDGRRFLENAWGVDRVIGGETAPFGFHVADIAPVSSSSIPVFQNEEAVGMDLWYDTWMDEKDFEWLNDAQRDASLFQTAVVDSPIAGLMQKHTLEPTVEEIPLDGATYHGIQVQGAHWHVEGKTDPLVPNVYLPGGTIKVGSLECPLAARDEGEYLFTLRLHSLSAPLSDLLWYQMRVGEKDLSVFAPSYKWTLPQETFTIRLDAKSPSLLLTLSPGDYEVEEAKLLWSSYRKLPEWTRNVNRVNLQHLAVQGDTICGTVENDTAGILALNLPYHKGWKAMDGHRPIPLIRVHQIMTGMVLAPGTHDIQLVYHPPGLRLGMALSGIGVLLLCWKGRKRDA